MATRGATLERVAAGEVQISLPYSRKLSRQRGLMHAVPLLVAYFAPPGRLRNPAAALFFLAQAFALLFVYPSPTDIS